MTWAYQQQQEAEEEQLGPQVAGQRENVGRVYRKVLVELPVKGDVLLEQAEEHHALPPLKSEVEARALHLPRRAPRLAVFAER